MDYKTHRNCIATEGMMCFMIFIHGGSQAAGSGGGRAGGSRAVLSSGGWAAGPRQLVVGRAQSCGKQLGRREGGQTHRMNQNWMFIT